MSVTIDNVKNNVTQEEIIRVLRAAGMMQEIRPARQEPRPEHEEMGLTYMEWFRRYVSDW